jgi:hypothetical protein
MYSIALLERKPTLAVEAAGTQTVSHRIQYGMVIRLPGNLVNDCLILLFSLIIPINLLHNLSCSLFIKLDRRREKEGHQEG